MAERSTDVLVIGGGAAGVLTAAKARALGKRVCLVARSVGASAFSSGAIDLAGDPHANPQRPSEEQVSIVENLETILKEEPWHPFHQVAAGARKPKEKALEVVGLFEAAVQVLMEKGALALRTDRRENRARLTGVGTFKFTAAAPETAGGFPSTELENLAPCFVGFPGLPGHLASRQAAVFDAARRITGTKATFVDISLPEALGPNASAVGLASLFDDERYAEQTAKKIASRLPAGTGVAVLPPVLGITRAAQAAAVFRAALPVPFVETLAVPPSPPGVRLNLALEKILSQAGVDLMSGEIEPVEARGGKIESLAVRLLDGREDRVSFHSAVLATGKFIGGGLRKEGRIREAIFGLPVTWRGRRFDSGINEEIFNTRYLGTQPAFAAGLSVDRSLRPVDEGGQPCFENLHAAGALLGGFDSVAGPSGLGLALVTGLAAGERAGAAV